MWGAPKRFLDRDVEAWHRECWVWLLRNLGGRADLRAKPLVLPTADFFPPLKEQGHARAEEVFLRVKTLMGLTDWPCALVPQRVTSGQVSEFVRLTDAKPAAGTFRVADGAPLVTYAPDLLARPYNLIATFAHELSHLLLHTIEEPAPGAEIEEGLEELATEMAVAYHGFGIIAANAAFSFSQFSEAGRQGWSSQTSGYFSEDAWVFALAVFLSLRDEDGAEARKHLKPHLAKKLDAALKRLVADPSFLAALD